MVDNESWYTSSLDASLKRRSFADYSSSSLSLSTFDGVLARPSSLKRHSQSGLRLSRKTLTQLTRTPPRLRLSARLVNLTVLPLCGYSSLLRALSNPAACTMLLLRRLEPFLSVKSKAAVAKSLLATLHLRGEVPAFLAALVLSEVQEQGLSSWVNIQLLRNHKFVKWCINYITELDKSHRTKNFVYLEMKISHCNRGKARRTIDRHKVKIG